MEFRLRVKKELTFGGIVSKKRRPLMGKLIWREMGDAKGRRGLLKVAAAICFSLKWKSISFGGEIKIKEVYLISHFIFAYF